MSPSPQLSTFHFQLSTLLVILVDQSTKYLVIHNAWPYIYNTGIAFSLPINNLLATIISIALVLILLAYRYQLYQGKQTNFFNLSLALVTGGAISNVLDRLHNPGVIDFIKLPFWPTFNIADVAVCTGIGILMILLYQDQKNASDKERNQDQ